MTFKLVFLVAAAVLMVVGTPIFLIWMLLTHKRDKGKERSGGGGISSLVGAVMLDLDRVIRPSIEHTIEVENTSPKREDDKGGD